MYNIAPDFYDGICFTENPEPVPTLHRGDSGQERYKMTVLHELRETGQSPWYDNITRDLLFSGGLKQLIDDGISGLTSNPTIFQKAFGSSPLYKNQLEEIKHGEIDTFEAYEQLAFRDILDATDCFEEVYESSGKIDGYVSIEVSPHYAHDKRSFCLV